MRERDQWKVMNKIACYYGYEGAFINGGQDDYHVVFIKAGKAQHRNVQLKNMRQGTLSAFSRLCRNSKIPEGILAIPTYQETVKEKYELTDEFTFIELSGLHYQPRTVALEDFKLPNIHAIATAEGGYTGVAAPRFPLPLVCYYAILDEATARVASFSQQQMQETIDKGLQHSLTPELLFLSKAFADNFPHLSSELLSALHDPANYSLLREFKDDNSDNFLTFAFKRNATDLINLAILAGVDDKQAITWCTDNLDARVDLLCDYLVNAANAPHWRSRVDGSHLVKCALRGWPHGHSRLFNLMNSAPFTERLLPANYNRLTDFTDYVDDENITFEYIRNPILPAINWRHPHSGKTLLDIAVDKKWYRVARHILNKPADHLNVETLSIAHLLKINFSENEFLTYLKQYFKTTAAAYKENNTPLGHLLLKKGWGEAFKVLLKNGLNMNLTDNDGDTVTHLMVTNPSLHGLLDETLSHKSIELNKLNNSGLSPLHLCAVTGHKEAAIKLTMAGADTDLRTNENKSLRDLSSQRSSAKKFFAHLQDGQKGEIARNTFRLLEACKQDADDVNTLKEIINTPTGVNLSLANAKGQVALTLAALKGHHQRVEYLLSLHTSTEQLLECGNQAIAAIHSTHHEIRKLIIEYMFDNDCIQGMTEASRSEFLLQQSSRLKAEIKRLKSELEERRMRDEAVQEQLQQHETLLIQLKEAQDSVKELMIKGNATVEELRQVLGLLNNNSRPKNK